MSGMETPLVCVCLPTYNSAATLKGTLASILGQTYSNILVMVVDNASSDQTVAIAREYAENDSRVSIFVNERNLGLEGNANRCIELSTGDYTAIYHSDDIYAPSIIEEEVCLLEANRDAAAAFSMGIDIDSMGRPGKLYKLPSTLPESGVYAFCDIFKAMLRYGNFLFCPTAMIRTEVYKNYIGKWDYEKYLSAADGDVWLRILKRYSICIINKPLLQYRASISSYSYHSARKKTGRHDMFKLFEDYLQGYAKPFVDSGDIINYSFLQLKDNINRAFNLFVMGDFPGARKLLRGVFIVENIYNSLICIERLKILFAGYTVYLLSNLNLSQSFRQYIMSVRYKG